MSDLPSAWTIKKIQQQQSQPIYVSPPIKRSSSTIFTGSFLALPRFRQIATTSQPPTTQLPIHRQRRTSAPSSSDIALRYNGSSQSLNHYASPSPPIPRTIFFYHRHDPHYCFTNFSPHTVEYQGKVYPTSEHLFQAFKFLDRRPGLAEHIRTFSTQPSQALSEARRFAPEVRPDWMSFNIRAMDITLTQKFQQHQDIRQELLATGDSDLIEDSDVDSFWGCGADKQGRNELGKALMRLRSVV